MFGQSVRIQTPHRRIRASPPNDWKANDDNHPKNKPPKNIKMNKKSKIHIVMSSGTQTTGWIPQKMLNPPLLMHPVNGIRFLTTMIRWTTITTVVAFRIIYIFYFILFSWDFRGLWSRHGGKKYYMPHDESPCHFRQIPLEKTFKYLPIPSPRGFSFLRVSLYISIPNHPTHTRVYTGN